MEQSFEFNFVLGNADEALAEAIMDLIVEKAEEAGASVGGGYVAAEDDDGEEVS